MRWWNSKTFRKWLRVLHRDLGYFAVGITLVYGISGIILNHKKQSVDPAYSSVVHTSTLPEALNKDELISVLTTEFSGINVNRIIEMKDGYRLFLEGGTGHYLTQTGELEYEVFKKRKLVFFINKLHYNQKHHWTVVADFSAVVMIFLALSGIFMIAGKNGLRRRGVWFMIGGFILVLIYIWI